MSEEQARERFGSLLMNRVPGSLDEHHATIGDRRREPARGLGVAVVELAGDESGRYLDPAELVPEWSHSAGAHAAERLRKSRGVIVHTGRSHLSEERRAAPLQTLEQGQAAPVIDESLEPLTLDSLRQRLVASPPTYARFLVEPGVSADGQERKDSFGPRCSNVERKAAAHRVADQVSARDPKAVPELHEIVGARIHRVCGAGPDTSRAMAAEIGQHPLPARRHQRD